ncbi:MAG TPA: hypothetical protein VFU16_08640 [Solirubrobacterales bacterium]|nr:hypothetical protein [Solirubrobacterales bacterium]
MVLACRAGAAEIDYFHQGLGHENPVPAWAEDEAVHFAAPPGEGPASEIEAMQSVVGVEGLSEEDLLVYGGGLVQTKPHIHLILWGANWQQEGLPQEVMQALKTFYAGLSGSDFQGILTQYFGNPLEEGGSYPEAVGNEVLFNPSTDVYVDTRVNAPTNVHRPAVMQEIKEVKALTGWKNGLQEQFVLVAGPGTTYEKGFGQGNSELSEGKTGFCGFHAYSESAYAFFGYNFCGGLIENVKTAAWEYADTVTDPVPGSGWLIKVLDGNGNFQGFVEAAEYCSPVTTKTSYGWVVPIKDNYKTNLEGGTTRHCETSDPDPPVASIGPTVAKPGQPGTVIVSGSIDLAGYHSMRYFGELHTSSGWIKASSGKIVSGFGTQQVAAELTGPALVMADKFRLVFQMPLMIDSNEYDGAIYSPTTPGPAWWRTTLCSSTAMPCPVGERVAGGAAFSSSPNSTPYYPNFSLKLTGKTRTISCTQGGPAGNVVSTAGQPLPISTTSWSMSGCSAASAGTGEGACTVTASSLPTAGSVNWRMADVGLIAGSTPRWHIECLSSSPPTNCTYTFGGMNGTIEGGQKAKMYVHSDPTTSGEVESGEACDGTMNGFNAHYLFDSPSPLHIAAFGQLQPQSDPGQASVLGVGENAGIRLDGTVNPNGFASTYQFQYVDAAHYAPGAENPYAGGGTSPVSLAAVGSGSQPVAVQRDLSGLQPGTTYHYRILGENVEGAKGSADATFTTPPACALTQCAYSLQAPLNPEPQQQSELADVSCPTTTVCMGLGNDYYRERGFLETWKNNSWSIAYTFPGTMKALSCPTSNWCMTVTKNEDDYWRLKWFENFGGTLSVDTSSPPLPQGASGLKINDVSCTSENACTMVGRYYLSGGYKTYAAAWNGTAWTQQSTPLPAQGDASEALLAVSCSSSTNCLAVGKAASKPFAERWNGSEWSLSSVPNPTGAVNASLLGVSCTAANACMAVGSYAKSETKQRTLAASFNGNAWTVLTSPNPAKEGDAILRDVSCLSGTSCIAAGSLASPTAVFLTEEESTLALSWNGTAWSLQSSPNGAGSLFSSFNAISCPAATACTVAGYTRPGGKFTQATLAARWK